MPRGSEGRRHFRGADDRIAEREVIPDTSKLLETAEKLVSQDLEKTFVYEQIKADALFLDRIQGARNDDELISLAQFYMSQHPDLNRSLDFLLEEVAVRAAYVAKMAQAILHNNASKKMH